MAIDSSCKDDPPELLPELHEEIARLPETYRGPIILCGLKGLTHEQAAEQLAVPIGTVKVRLSRAKDRLRSRLRQRGLVPSAGLLAAALSADATAAIPARLVHSTAQEAIRFATGGAAAGTTALTAATLAKGVLRAMILTKVTPPAVLAALLLIALAVAPVLSRPAVVRADPQDNKAVAAGERAPETSATNRDDRDSALAVPTESLKRSDLQVTTSTTATVEPAQTADLYARVSGVLQSLKVDLGGRVPKGEVLAQIDVRALQADVARQRALYQQARAQVLKSKAAVRAAEVALRGAAAKVEAAAAELERAEASVRFHEKQRDRLNQLREKAAVPTEVADETQLKYEAVLAARQAAKAELAVARVGQEEGEVKVEQAKADLVQTEAALEIAKVELDQAEHRIALASIVSPFDGIVARINFHEGDLVRSQAEGATKPVLTVIKTDTMRVVVDVPERDVPLLNKGDAATVRINAVGGRVFRGSVSRIAVIEDPRNRTLRAEIDLPNHDGHLRPGQFGLANIVLDEQAHVLTIPATALIEHKGNGDAECFRVVDGRAARTGIIVGAEGAGRFVVLKGLSEGDIVVANPAGKVRDRQRIEAAKVERPR
jgi:RND family efflux transporter MFP subunit